MITYCRTRFRNGNTKELNMNIEYAGDEPIYIYIVSYNDTEVYRSNEFRAAQIQYEKMDENFSQIN